VGSKPLILIVEEQQGPFELIIKESTNFFKRYHKNISKKYIPAFWSTVLESSVMFAHIVTSYTSLIYWMNTPSSNDVTTVRRSHWSTLFGPIRVDKTSNLMSKLFRQRLLLLLTKNRKKCLNCFTTLTHREGNKSLHKTTTKIKIKNAL